MLWMNFRRKNYSVSISVTIGVKDYAPIKVSQYAPTWAECKRLLITNLNTLGDKDPATKLIIQNYIHDIFGQEFDGSYLNIQEP